MPEQSAAAEQALARFAEVVRQAHEEVAAVISAISDDQEALKHSIDFFRLTEALYTLASRVRTQSIGRIWESQELSLTALAGESGVTRQRIGQLVDAYQRAKAAAEEAEEEAPA